MSIVKYIGRESEKHRPYIFMLILGMFIGGMLVWIILVPISTIGDHLFELLIIYLVSVLICMIISSFRQIKERAWSELPERLKKRWIYNVPIIIALIVKVVLI